MELIDYLNHRFFSREQLLARCGAGGDMLDELQRLAMMPRPSYRLRLEVACDSFFGPHTEQVAVEYYAQGCVAWFGLLQTLDSPAQAFEVFADRYRSRIGRLAAEGIRSAHADLAADAHVAAEWRHFLDGTYGVCTVSGLPEDIAAKEVAGTVIKDLTAEGPQRTLTVEQRRRLGAAVDLLDRSSAPFAPHEVARSSRRRLVDEVRRDWQL
jgi:hypothetical protein